MKNIKNMKNKNMKGSCFCLLLLTAVIIYLSVKPEGFKEGHEIRYRHNHYGIGDISGNDISHNHITSIYIDTTEKEKEVSKEVPKPGISQTQLQTQTQTQPVQSKSDLENILDWFNINKFTNAHLALFAIVFVLFIIIMFVIIKLSQI